MTGLKSRSQKYVELKKEGYLLLIKNTIKMEVLKIVGIEKMPICKATEHILEHKHIDLLVESVSRRCPRFFQADNNASHKQNQCLSVPNDSV